MAHTDGPQWLHTSPDEGYWSLRDLALVAGLTGYGLSMALMVRAGLGLDPWDVLHQGLSVHTGLSIGLVSAVVGVLVLLAWIPLRNTPGVGTIANIVIIAVTVDAGLGAIEPPASPWARTAMLLGGVGLNALATVLYIGAGLGAGPRDGLMTGLVARTGRSVRLVRTSIEVSALTVGWLLGAAGGVDSSLGASPQIGVGTLVYALGIGPLVQLVLQFVPKRILLHSGWAATIADQAAHAEPCDDEETLPSAA